uniref:Very-long-chain (3R)-3-hydroxyacyl-CoA dehydratase n=1 Tax=Glossina brevipalpis TaxID=37001 RepID=A0A1A9WME6_9MUSC
MTGPKTTKPPTKEQSLVVKAYLFIYNAIQVLGWSYILYQLIDYYLLQSSDFRKQTEFWSYIHLAVIVFQNAACAEIMHSSLGFVKSNPVITTFQVFSRIMVVVGVIMATPTAKLSPGLPTAILAWSVTEIIRYSYYALNIIRCVPYFITFLRYSTFYILYPIGVSGELVCFWWAQSYAKSTSVWSLELPNKYNVTFSYYICLWVIMLSYIPLFPKLFMHMVAQRHKILTPIVNISGSPDKKRK